MSTSKFTGFYKIVTPNVGSTAMADNQSIGDHGTYANYTWYQRLIQGSASRITRYREYDLMDNDVEIAMALDIIAEEMIGSNPNDDLPIEVVVDTVKDENVTSSEVMTLKSALRYWNSIHDWTTRLFKVARVTVKYGDCFFIRRNNTSKWEYVHPKNVIAAVVDDQDITRVVGWQIKKDIKVANTPYSQSQTGNNPTTEMADIYPADQVVWFSLNDDISESAPFGESVLRAIYRAQKQKELLEDAILIYRIQRAPERRAFYIDGGKLPPQRAKDLLERTKNEIRQRKIPTANGGINEVDSVYNPMSMNEDFFFLNRPDGKGSRVEVLPGGQSVGETGDLEYFQGKVYRGLRIPMSYMKDGQDGGGITNDGKTGIAYIQEQRFALYVKRLQGYISQVLDKEFKRYVRSAGINIDPTIYHLTLKEPENFGGHRQQQFDADLLSTYSQAQGMEALSKRFGMKKYLQLTDAEILENERKRAEEMGIDPDNITKADLKIIYGSSQDMMGGMGGGMMPPGGDMMAGTMGMDGDGLDPATMSGDMPADAGGMPTTIPQTPQTSPPTPAVA